MKESEANLREQLDMAITDDVKHQEELKNAHAKLKEIERQMHERSKFEH